MSDDQREVSPGNTLPNWDECALRVSNSDYLSRRKAEGGYGPEDSDSPQAKELHRFIHEYDDADPYRSSWFLHRLELLLNETRADLESQLASAKAEIERLREEQESERDGILFLRSNYGAMDNETFFDFVRRVKQERDEAYERAAQVCERYPSTYAVISHVARVIRALKSKPNLPDEVKK